MYTIKRTKYGYKLTFGDFISEDEMMKWVEESKKALEGAPKAFGILVDMRTLKALPPEAQEHMEKGQRLYKTKGMQKSAVVLANALTKMQFKRIGQQSGIYQWERYIDEATNPDWERVGVDWIQNGIDPDK